MGREFVIGTRGSRLARVQTDIILKRLQQAQPATAFRVVEVKTEGDRRAQESLLPMAGRGVFVQELERALRLQRIDLAVHSLKDMPSNLPPDMCLAAVAEREDPRDALVSHSGLALAKLPAGSRLGTSSPRRVAQLRALCPDLRFLPLRGNVDTRLRKVSAGEVEGAILALAGLRRLGLEGQVTEVIPADVCLPAVGQGALAVEARSGDAEAIALAQLCDHPPTHQAAVAERAFLHGLGGGCQTPIAAWGRLESGRLLLDGLVAAPDGSRLVRERVAGDPEAAEALGQELAHRVLALGAGELLKTYG